MVTDARDNGKISTIFDKKEDFGDGRADFERAVSTTGFGTFNVLLVLAALPVAWSGVFDTTTSAFILASAECDLQLTFFRKGVLVSFPYIAMTLTTFLWDYITPYAGMRSLFLLAIFADSLLNVLSSAASSYYVFLLVKFLTGILAGGPLAMVMPYLAEFHSAKYKARFTTWVGLLYAIANIVPAALGFSILPQEWNFDIFGRNYSAWRIYILVCSIVPIIGIATASMLPESPKYLMEIGRPDEALKLLRRIYVINTRKPADTFPIKALVGGGQLSRPLLKASTEKIRLGWYNTKLLFSTTYLPAVSFLCLLQFGSMLGFNTMRLWVPHLFIIINNFDAENWIPKGRAPTMCEILNPRASVPARKYLQCPNFEDACMDWKINAVIYQNSTVIATSAVFFAFLTGLLLQRHGTKLCKKILLITAFLISVVSSFGMNWAQAPPYMLTLAAAIIVTTRIAGNIVTTVNADVIPIPLRATSISILTTVGNVGAITGNFILSALLGIECLAAFMAMGCLFSVCFFLSFFLPKPTKPSPRGLAQPEA